MSFSTSAMLVSLNVKQFSAKREDKKISSKVAADHNAKGDAGRYTKNLVSKSRLEAIATAATAMRDFHYKNSLPWLDSGVRILPSKNYEAYKARMALLRDAFDQAVRAFVASWPEAVQEARGALGSMFNAADYPADVATKFDVTVRFMPVADPSDFRVQISDTERAMLQRDIAATMQAAQDAAMRDIWERVSECVNHMAERLRAFKVVGGKTENTFRDTLVTNLRDLVDLIPRLNFTNDPRLEKIREEIAAELLRASAADLRNDFKVREDVAKKAEDIAARVAEFMV